MKAPLPDAASKLLGDRGFIQFDSQGASLHGQLVAAGIKFERVHGTDLVWIWLDRLVGTADATDEFFRHEPTGAMLLLPLVLNVNSRRINLISPVLYESRGGRRSSPPHDPGLLDLCSTDVPITGDLIVQDGVTIQATVLVKDHVFGRIDHSKEDKAGSQIVQYKRLLPRGNIVVTGRLI